MRKQEYIQPKVELTQLKSNAMILSISPTGMGIGEVIDGGVGG